LRAVAGSPAVNGFESSFARGRSGVQLAALPYFFK